MGRAPCCDKSSVKRGPWSPEEDGTLRTYIQTHGTGGNWIALPRKAGLRRCGKSCRLRWLNYLRPDIKHGGFTEEEDDIILSLYGQMGSRWSAIASRLPGRTDNDVKNYWNTKLKKKLMSGKVNLKTVSYDTHTTTTTLPSTQSSLTHNVQTQNQNPDFAASQINHTSSSSPTLQIPTDANSGGFHHHINAHNTMISFDPSQLYSPGFMDVSEINASSSMMSSLSQEGSSISDSSLMATENKLRVSLPDHAGDEATQVLMNFRFGGYHSDLVNNVFDSHEKIGEFASSFYPHELADFGYNADMKPQGRN